MLNLKTTPKIANRACRKGNDYAAAALILKKLNAAELVALLAVRDHQASAVAPGMMDLLVVNLLVVVYKHKGNPAPQFQISALGRWILKELGY